MARHRKTPKDAESLDDLGLNLYRESGPSTLAKLGTKEISENALVVEAAKVWTIEAIDVLKNVMNDTKTPKALKIKAAVALLDRGWGAPARTTIVSGKVDHRHAHELSREELLQIAQDGVREEYTAELQEEFDAGETENLS